MEEQKRTLHYAWEKQEPLFPPWDQYGNPVHTAGILNLSSTEVMCYRVSVLLYGTECWRMTEKDNRRLADGNHLTAKAMEMATGYYGIEWASEWRDLYKCAVCFSVCMWRLRKLWSSILSFSFQKNAGVSSFKDNYLETNAWLPQFFFVDYIPYKDLLFQRGPNLAQKPLHLVSTVLKETAWSG